MTCLVSACRSVTAQAAVSNLHKLACKVVQIAGGATLDEIVSCRAHNGDTAPAHLPGPLPCGERRKAQRGSRAAARGPTLVALRRGRNPCKSRRTCFSSRPRPQPFDAAETWRYDEAPSGMKRARACVCAFHTRQALECAYRSIDGQSAVC